MTLDITQHVIAEALIYDAQTGALFWKDRPERHFADAVNCRAWNSKFAGKSAFFTKTLNGYRMGTLFGRRLLAHRVIWVLVNGVEPDQIDHINGVRYDNRIVNLRNVSFTENAQNHKRHCCNKSGVVGVSIYKRHKKWRANIGYGPTYRHLGFFDSFDDAVAARREAEKHLGYHPNHGRDE